MPIKKTTTPPVLIPTGFINEKNLSKVLGFMQDNKGEIDTYTATKLVYGQDAYARNYRFATGNFMRTLADSGWVRWTQKRVAYRGSIVIYELTPKGKTLLETIKP